MTTVATRMARPIFQKDGLDLGFEELEIQSVAGFWLRLGLGRGLPLTVATNPRSERLPFRVIPRSPEFPASMGWVTARFDRQGMQQQAAFRWMAWRYQLRDCLEIEARLFFGPCWISGQQGRELKPSGQRRMAVVAAKAILTLLEKDWLDVSAIGSKVEGRLHLRRRSDSRHYAETGSSYDSKDQTSKSRRFLVGHFQGPLEFPSSSGSVSVYQ